MASKDGKAECDRHNDGKWLDDDVSDSSGAPLRSASDDHVLARTVNHVDECVVDHCLPYPDLSHCVRHSTSLLKPSTDDGNGELDADDDAHICHWRKSGKALRNCLSQTSETSLLFGNDDTLVTGASIDCQPEPADRSVSRAYAQCSSTDDSDLGLVRCRSLPVKSHNVGCSSLPANDLLLLDDDSETSFLPLFRKLRQRISSLDSEHQEELPPTSWQRKDRPKGHGRALQLSTWSEFSSSDESDSHWLRANVGRRHRQSSSGRRLMKSDERCSDDLWARSCSEELDYCSSERSSFSHHGSRRRRKKSATEKCSSVRNDKLANDAPSPLESGITKQQKTWHRSGASFTECLADVESNATDSDNIGHFSNDDDEDGHYANTKKIDGMSSSVMAPIACSFHCMPPERQTTRLTASSIDYSPASSPVCDKGDPCMSSENELSPALGSGHISDHNSFQSSCSFGGIYCANSILIGF